MERIYSDGPGRTTAQRTETQRRLDTARAKVEQLLYERIAMLSQKRRSEIEVMIRNAYVTICHRRWNLTTRTDRRPEAATRCDREVHQKQTVPTEYRD